MKEKLTKTNIEPSVSRELNIRCAKLGMDRRKYQLYRILAKIPLKELKDLLKYIK